MFSRGDYIHGPTTRTDQFYGSSVPGGRTQPSATPLSAGQDTSPKPMAAPSPHVAISWIGVLIALVALRVVYEVSE